MYIAHSRHMSYVGSLFSHHLLRPNIPIHTKQVWSTHQEQLGINLLAHKGICTPDMFPRDGTKRRVTWNLTGHSAW